MADSIKPPTTKRKGGRARTGSVYEHGDHLDVRLTLPDGRRSRPIHLRDLRAKCEADLERGRERARKWTDLAARGELVLDDVDQPEHAPLSTLAGIATRWTALVNAGDLAPGTKTGHARAARRVAERFGKLAPAQLGTPELRTWLRELRATGRSPVTVRATFFSLSKMMEDATAEGWIDLPNPCRHPAVRAELPEVETPDDEDKARHSAAEAAALVLDPRVPMERRLRYVLAFTTGMRDGELAGLRWSSLVVRNGVPCYRVHQALALQGDEGRATPRKPKTRSSKRYVPIHPAAAHALEQWRSFAWRAFVGREPQADDPILPNRKGLPWRPDSAALFRADLEAIGLSVSFEGTPFTFHSTRRTFTSQLEAKGVPGSRIDRLLGEADDSVRGRHYAGSDLPVLAADVALLDLPGVQVADPAQAVPSRPIATEAANDTAPALASTGTDDGFPAVQWTGKDNVIDHRPPTGGAGLRC